YSLGYVYLPAVIGVSAVSYFTAPLGAALAHRLPVRTLKRIFALVLLALLAKMLHSLFG
ncbi:MAG: TSUP family transporter, partial [Tepidiphilus sp.]